jgi:NitT/TauT family transport system permease protein
MVAPAGLTGYFPLLHHRRHHTAAGGAWNASIVAEWVSWGDKTLKATGLGEYIQASTIAGDFPKIALGTAMMCLYVLIFNHIIWRPLYRLAEKRFNLN